MANLLSPAPSGEAKGEAKPPLNATDLAEMDAHSVAVGDADDSREGIYAPDADSLAVMEKVRQFRDYIERMYVLPTNHGLRVRRDDLLTELDRLFPGAGRVEEGK